MNRRSITQLFTALAVVVSASAALAEPDAYMRIKGTKSGDIRGSVTMKGREGTIAIVALEHELKMPVDTATGMATGKRQHKPLIITKEIDKSSPLLRQALINNEVLQDVTIQFYQPSRTGAETNYFTIELKNARVTNVQHVMQDNRDAAAAKVPASERVAFTYDTITWTFTDGGVTATDSTGGAAR